MQMLFDSLDEQVGHLSLNKKGQVLNQT